MAQISVAGQADGTFLVEVRSGGTTTSHTVSVPVEFPAVLGCEHVPRHELVRASFGFLLEREPPTSILRRFSLDVIGDYFPEYTAEMRTRLGGGGTGAA